MQVPVRWANAGRGGGPPPARALDACPGQARRRRSWYLVSVGVVDYSGLGLLSENRERERETVRVGQYILTGVRDRAQRAADETDSDERGRGPCVGGCGGPWGAGATRPQQHRPYSRQGQPGGEGRGPEEAGTVSQSPTPHRTGLCPSASGLWVSVPWELATDTGDQTARWEGLELISQL